MIKLLAEGKANKEIAAVLELSTRTVEVGELVRYEVRHNLIEA